MRHCGDAVALCPPLVITPAEIDEMLARFRGARDTGDGKEKGLAVAVTPIIEFDGVCKTYDGLSNVVDQLDLAMPRVNSCRCSGRPDRARPPR